MNNENSFEQSSNFHPQERLLTRRMLRQMVPVSDMTIWRWERDGFFPGHLTVNSRNYWLLSEVKAWLAAQKRGKIPSAGGCHD
jgi:predicted DNA-binding transcriptional regulator AlpA